MSAGHPVSLNRQPPIRQQTGRFHRRALGMLGMMLAISTSPTLVYAGKVYQFRDADGNVLFTNMVSGSSKPVGKHFEHFETLEKVTVYKESNVHHYSNWGGGEGDLPVGLSRNRDAYEPLISTAAQNSGIEKALVKAVIHTESGFNPNAVSRPGAQGLMQLMPATASRYQVSNPFDPEENIRAGVRHLAYLLGRYSGNLELALAAYNAGEANVQKYNGIPPFEETRDYVKRVISRYRHVYNGSA